MLLRRTTITLLASAIALTSSSPASACWLTDWLYGRPAANPYAVGYSPYAAGYAPVTVGQPSMLASGGVPVGTMPWTGLTPSTGFLAPATQPSYRLPIAQPRNSYALQRPAYLDNPSVYTGRPVNTAVAPTVLPLRGANTTSNPFYGTGNQYPTNLQAPVTSYQPAITGSINSGAAGFLPTAPSNLPTVSAIPQFTTPAYTAPRPTGGLARFFGSLLGTNYRSSYYAAPITYYRPATSIDPITGTTVTVQQPCDSYVQQLQRTPYTGFQVAPSSVAPTTADCNTAYGAMGQTYMGQAQVGQVGAYGNLDRTDPNLIPIPSIGDQRPLTSRDLPQVPAVGDSAPMRQPTLSDSRSSQRPDSRLETAPRGFDETSSKYVDPLDPANFADGIPADGQWRVRSSTDPSASGLSPGSNDLGSYDLGSFGTSTVRPIPAPADYRNPYQSETESRSPAARQPTIDESRYETTRPPIDLAPSGSSEQTPSRYLPPSTRDLDMDNTFTSKPMPGNTSREYNRLSVPVREASMERTRETTPIQRRHDNRNARRPAPPVPSRGSKSNDWKAN